MSEFELPKPFWVDPNVASGEAEYYIRNDDGTDHVLVPADDYEKLKQQVAELEEREKQARIRGEWLSKVANAALVELRQEKLFSDQLIAELQGYVEKYEQTHSPL